MDDWTVIKFDKDGKAVSSAHFRSPMKAVAKADEFAEAGWDAAVYHAIGSAGDAGRPDYEVSAKRPAAPEKNLNI